MAAAAHSSSLSPFAVTALRDSGQSFQAHVCGPELTPTNPYLLRVPPPPSLPKLILILNLTHNFPIFSCQVKAVFIPSPGIQRTKRQQELKNKKGRTLSVES